MICTLDLLGLIGLIPITKFDNIDHVVPVMKALLQAKIPAIEIVFRSSYAAKALNILTSQFPQVTLCAGTILTIDDVNTAYDNGAQILFSPGFNPKIIEYSLKKDIQLIPGVSNPSLIQQAVDLGLTMLKFFPAEQMGGITMLKTFAEIYPNIKFIPSGDIKENNISNYIQLKNVHAIGGSWMTHSKLILNKEFETITNLAKRSLLILHNFNMKCLQGCKNKTNRNRNLDFLECISDTTFSEGNMIFQTFFKNLNENQKTSIFESENNENCLILYCNNLQRAQFYFEKQGFQLKSHPFFENLFSRKVLQFTENFAGLSCFLTDDL